MDRLHAVCSGPVFMTASLLLTLRISPVLSALESPLSDSTRVRSPGSMYMYAAESLDANLMVVVNGSVEQWSELFGVNSTATQNVSVVPASTDVNATQDEANVINATDDFTAIYLAIGLFGFFSNLSVVVVIVTYRPMRDHITNLYIINQSLIDASVAAFLCLTTVLQDDERQLTPGSWSDEALCRLWFTKMPLWGLLVSSTYSLVSLSVERFLAVVYPLQYRAWCSRRRALVTMAVTWIIGPAYNIAYMTPSSAILPSGQCTVYTEWPGTVTQSIVGLLTITVQFILPLVFLVYAYVRMAIILHRLVVAERSTGLEIGNDDVVRARANVIKTLATVSLFFILCWSWNQTYYLMFYLGYQHVDFTSAFYNFTVIMVFLNCCVNPIIYSVRYDQFRRGVMSLFCRKCLDDVAEVPTQTDTLSSVEHRYCSACDCAVVKLLFTTQQQSAAAEEHADAPTPTQSQHTV